MAKIENASHSELLDRIFEDLDNLNKSKDKSQFNKKAEEYSETLQEFWQRTNLEQISLDGTFFLNDEENGGFLITREVGKEASYVKITPDSQVIAIRSEIIKGDKNNSKIFYELQLPNGIINSIKRTIINENPITKLSEFKPIEQIFVNRS